MEVVKLSKRLQTVAKMVTKGNLVADVGTDHGYLPIYLVQNNIADRVIAMDINKGPLSKAHKNIKQFCLEDKIETRLSDGLINLKKDEVHTITICGMGGKLIAKILENGKSKISNKNELIVSPQSEIQQFRLYLLQNNFIILEEDMIIDDEKYYVIIKCAIQGDQTVGQEIMNESNVQDVLLDSYLKYGKYLLLNKNSILKQFLENEKMKYSRLRENVVNCDSKNASDRIKEIDYELSCIDEGLNYYEM